MPIQISESSIPLVSFQYFKDAVLENCEFNTKGAIGHGKINCVITKDLSRLGRNYVMTSQYTDFYFPIKVMRYIAINDNVDTLNGESELAPFLNVLNEMHIQYGGLSLNHTLMDNPPPLCYHQLTPVKTRKGTVMMNFDFNMHRIGQTIARMRREHNMTQIQLADEMGVSYQAASNWERGVSHS